jgi:hypothetical protein
MVGGRKMNSVSIHSQIKEAEAREFKDLNFAVLVLKSDDLEIHLYFNNKEEIRELIQLINNSYENIKVIKK